MRILVKRAPGVELPNKAHPNEDLGFDVKAISEPKIVGKKAQIVAYENESVTWWHSIDYIEYDTGLQIAPDKRTIINYNSKGFCEEILLTHTLGVSRSSVSKKNLSLCNCVAVIDSGYKNNILYRFNYLWQPEDFRVLNGLVIGKINYEKIYVAGDRIGQIFPFSTQEATFEFVDELPETERSMGGFGSSGN